MSTSLGTFDLGDVDKMDSTRLSQTLSREANGYGSPGRTGCQSERDS